MSTIPTDFESFSRRAAGRYRYNKLRQFQAAFRLLQVVAMLKKFGLGRGTQSRIAERLGVHRGTICRYVAKLERRYWGGRQAEKQHLDGQRMRRRVQAEEKVERDWLEQRSAEGT